MYYKQLEFFEFEKEDIIQFYLENYKESIFSLEKYPTASQFVHRGSDKINHNDIKKFTKLFKNLNKLFINETFFGRFFVTKPNSKGNIHIDMFDKKSVPRTWSLNIPLINCLETHQEWFKIDSPPIEMPQFNSWFWLHDENALLEESLELKVPTIVNVSLPHRINNPITEYRVVFAIRTSRNHEYDFDK